MACSSMNIPPSQILTTRRSDNNCTIHRSSSTDNLRKKTMITRSHSDNYLSNNVCFIPTPTTVIMPRQSYVRRTMLFDTEVDALVDDENDDKDDDVKRMSWIEKLMELRMLWKGRQKKNGGGGGGGDSDDDDSDGGGCPVDYDEGVDEDVEFDLGLFSRFLAPVPLLDARRFAKLAFLSNKAYKIAQIKTHELKLQHGLEFHTSSLEKKAEAIALKAKLDKDSTNPKPTNPDPNPQPHPKDEQIISRSMAYEIAASAASHVHTHAKNDSNSAICGENSKDSHEEVGSVPGGGGSMSEMAAQMAASTMTAVVAAREREKRAAAKELRSLHSSPCDWFVCDDVSTCVRYFVIQKMLYSPLGQIFIIQPPENSSPSHPLLPSGCALYAFDKTESNSAENALRAFLNTPHPLETLSDPKAYGFEGSILRNHHSDNFMSSVFHLFAYFMSSVENAEGGIVTHAILFVLHMTLKAQCSQ